MAKKETKKEADDRELKYLTENQLTAAELAAIRKLNGATNVPGHPGSRRTVEAVLQGRRSNPRLLQRAIYNALDELKRYSKIMDDLLNKLKG